MACALLFQQCKPIHSAFGVKHVHMQAQWSCLDLLMSMLTVCHMQGSPRQYFQYACLCLTCKPQGTTLKNVQHTDEFFKEAFLVKQDCKSSLVHLFLLHSPP